MRYDYLFEAGTFDSFKKEIFYGKYAVVEYPNTINELIMDYQETELDAFKSKKEKYPKARVIKANIIMICYEDMKVIFDYEPIE